MSNYHTPFNQLPNVWPSNSPKEAFTEASLGPKWCHTGGPGGSEVVLCRSGTLSLTPKSTNVATSGGLKGLEFGSSLLLISRLLGQSLFNNTKVEIVVNLPVTVMHTADAIHLLYLFTTHILMDN